MTPRSGSIRIRTVAGFALVATLAPALTLAATALVMVRTLRQDERIETRSRSLAYWAVYHSGGLEGLESEIERDNLTSAERPIGVRIAAADNRTLLISYPPGWSSFALERLANLPLDADHRLGSPELDYDLDVTGIWLVDDEAFLQLAVSTERRSHLVALLRRNAIAIAVVVLVSGCAAGAFGASRALAPLQTIGDVAEQVATTGDVGARIDLAPRNVDMRRLVDLMNAMFARVEESVTTMREGMDALAHDLRTPLTRLRAHAELALRSSDASPADLAAALAEAVEQTDGLLLLVNGLLDIGQAEHGRLALRREAVDLNRIAAEVAELYTVVAEERGVTIRVHPAAAARVSVDRVRIRQALANLVDNAVKFSFANATVRVDLDGDESEVRIAVRDDGPGIPAEEQDKVWNRLFRGELQPKQRGLGLGLSLVRAYVTAHGGRVWLDSTVGGGSTFGVGIPRGG